eukprot:1698945-Lingulodinium_polyedra.AAC.1
MLSCMHGPRCEVFTRSLAGRGALRRRPFRAAFSLARQSRPPCCGPITPSWRTSRSTPAPRPR